MTTVELLFQLYGDPVVEGIFSLDQTVRSWLEVEAALARALGGSGVIPDSHVEAITGACDISTVDQRRLWEETRVVGYPVLPLVRMICQALPPEAAAFVHWGATTQDIMDTALVLQVSRTARRLFALLDQFGDNLAQIVEAHRSTVMAARTHGQQAVPTTFGAKCAPLLDQVSRDWGRLHAAAQSAAVVSLFGAGGTSAALGQDARTVRSALASHLGLQSTAVPWHAARDRLVELAVSAILASQTAVRFAREVVDLSRTELREVAEADGEYRGASSTMPQKANPILAEAIIGFGAAGAAMSGALLRAMETQQERAAGEWQVEWQALPYVLRSVAGSLSVAGQLAKGLRVFPKQMRENMALDQGLVLAEAYMFRLAPVIGRDKAHDLVYRAARQSRVRNLPLPTVLAELVGPELRVGLGDIPIEAEQYLGDVNGVCDEALASWEARKATGPYMSSVPEPFA
jgi:3-carboxy-cis,cis-muconate cycloisomerase